MARTSMGTRMSIWIIPVSTHPSDAGYKEAGPYWVVRAGKYAERDMPNYTARNFEERGFTVGIGGYVCLSLLVSC